MSNQYIIKSSIAQVKITAPEFSGTMRKEKDVSAKKILVVDDNESILAIIRHWLDGAGYRTDTTPHPAKAVHMVRDNGYDLVILDVMMEEMNGIEVIERLRADEKTAHVPVMVITALSLQRHFSEETIEMLDDILAKPFHKDELLERVERALLSRRTVKK